MKSKNPYTKTDWLDQIIDIETGEVIQKGTKFTASRANNIEDGIYNAYEQLDRNHDTIQKLRVQIDMIGRAPVNNGTFFDTFDGENAKQLNRLTAQGFATQALSSGATTINVTNAVFAVDEVVTVYDDVNSENVKITAVAGNTLTVAALTKSYKKGAGIARSNAREDYARQRLLFGTWGTYDVAITEVS